MTLCCLALKVFVKRKKSFEKLKNLTFGNDYSTKITSFKFVVGHNQYIRTMNLL